MSGPSSPAPSESETRRHEPKFQFCQECSNLLYPKEDRDLHKLLYVCKACHATTESESACTWQLNLSASVQETAGVTTDVANDPTVGGTPIASADLPCFCTMCGEQTRCAACGEPQPEDLPDRPGTSDMEAEAEDEDENVERKSTS